MKKIVSLNWTISYLFGPSFLFVCKSNQFVHLFWQMLENKRYQWFIHECSQIFSFFLRCHLVVIVSRFLALRDKWIFLLKEVHLIILFLCQALVMNFRLVDNLVWDVSTSFVTFWSDDFAICYEIQILKNKEFGNGCSIWLLYSKIPTRIEQR